MEQRSLMDKETAAMLDYVGTTLHGSGAHGFDHTERVVRLCEVLGAGEGADMAVLIPAAIFHDIARPIEEEIGIPHEEAGARMAAAYLESIDYPADRIAGIVHAIRAHRYSSGIDPETSKPDTLGRGQTGRDGRVGIARTFMQAATLRQERSGSTGRNDVPTERSSSTVRCELRLTTSPKGREFKKPEGFRLATGGIPDAADHIRAKLLNLKGLMYTQSARSLAERRHAFLVAFLDALEDETCH
jgi:uncharacterized protein